MGEFFSGMSTLESVLWILALIGSTGFVLMFALSMIGADSDADLDIDTDISTDHVIGFQFLTLKNVMAFLTIFGWTGIVCLDKEFSVGSTLTISILAGLTMMLIMTFLFFWISKLAESGTLKIENAIGNIGEVYLSIGANRSRIGKISIDVQGAKRELNALTDNDQDLKQGEVIKVVEVINGELLLVEKLTK